MNKFIPENLTVEHVDLSDGDPNDSNTFTTRFTQVHNAIKTLNAEDFATEALEECFLQHRLTPEVFTAVIAAHLPDKEGNMTVDDKQYWLQMADKMGPAWIESFRRTAAFMAKVGGF
jgi:hypothetical protein